VRPSRQGRTDRRAQAAEQRAATAAAPRRERSGTQDCVTTAGQELQTGLLEAGQTRRARKDGTARRRCLDKAPACWYRSESSGLPQHYLGTWVSAKQQHRWRREKPQVSPLTRPGDVNLELKHRNQRFNSPFSSSFLCMCVIDFN